MSITSAADGALWLGSISHGIFRFDPTTETFTNYDRDDGLAGNAMLLSSIFQEDDGTIWMGGQDGLQRFHPTHIRARPQVQDGLLDWVALRRFRSDTTITERYPETGAKGITIGPEDNSKVFTTIGSPPAPVGN